MTAAITTGLAGALAQTVRIGVSASNVANATTRGALPGADGTTPEGQPPAPTALRTVQTAGPESAAAPRARAVPANPPFSPVFEPDSPFADGAGLVAAANVSLLQETVDQLGALRSFQANLQTVKAADEIVRSTLDLTA